MHKLEKLICDEIEKFEDKNTLSMSDLEIVHKLTDTYKNLKKIEMLDGDDGMSGRHWVRGHYSRDYDRRETVNRLEEAMSHADERDRSAISRAISEINGR